MLIPESYTLSLPREGIDSLRAERIKYDLKLEAKERGLALLWHTVMITNIGQLWTNSAIGMHFGVSSPLF